ncbi:hypothetical protein AAV35_000335 [Salimicrobium jeotgali]|uniref:Uncharacterized protein n=2 Tax=Bacillaceae TaxID=186817 RepID=K2H4G1_9BACI|nr:MULTISPECIES: hypothetical protein [Bacillaceae]AKG03382.1 hypothetical protein AAV35_000335 [Salimicrobium jeotgali]ALX49723.1 hypothetical protein AOX59_14760 [Lentibacillus amyloliquefaciens]EKE30765.1 hypothetical protein MJ3_11900 [Salimicrobium jeotgali]MBM7697537.1 hypothetical protein [Salimicrobium jeotgali]
MSIITSKHLKEKIINYNLIPLKVSLLKISNQIYIDLDNVEDFLNFASGSNLEYIYYYYTYYNSEEYIIPNDWYSEYSKEFKTEVIQHNRYIESLDFDSPRNLTLFTLQNGTFVGIELGNQWIENQGICVAEEAIEIIENEFYREVKKVNDSKKIQQKNDENNLREIIFKDTEFRFCKNQELRYWYLVELLEKENMVKYKYLVEPYGIPNNGRIKIFMDKTWELYKERKK